jgi:hypothetical protein
VTTLPVRPGVRSIGDGRDPSVSVALLGDVGLASGLHLIRDRQGSGSSRTQDCASGRDAGPGRDARLGRLLPRLHDESGPSRCQGHLHAAGAQPIGASRLLGIHPWLTARPPATQRLRRAAGPLRAWRVPTPDRPRSRLVYGPMPTRGLARRLAYLTRKPFGHPGGGHRPCSSDSCVVEDGGGPVGHRDLRLGRPPRVVGHQLPAAGLSPIRWTPSSWSVLPGLSVAAGQRRRPKFDRVVSPFTRPDEGRHGVNL